MLSSGDVQLFEVKAFEEDFHSWFVGQTVQRGNTTNYTNTKVFSLLDLTTALMPSYITTKVT